MVKKTISVLEYKILEVTKKIEKLSKAHTPKITRLACQRWANKIREQERLEREIKTREKELEQLKKIKR